jgi:hypothetical protein
MPVGEVPVPAVRSRPLGKCLGLLSANGSRFNAPERVFGVTGRNGAGASVLGEDPRLVRENGGLNRISEVWDCQFCVLSLFCCDPLRRAAHE